MGLGRIEYGETIEIIVRTAKRERRIKIGKIISRKYKTKVGTDRIKKEEKPL